MKPKKIQASAAETTTQRLGAQQAGLASAMKSRLSTAVNKSAVRDDSAIIRNAASSATASSTASALTDTSTPMERAAVISGGANGRARAMSDANVTAKGSMVDRIGEAVKLGFGAQEGSSSSITRLASAQNNAAFTVADAKMRNTQATLGAIGGAISTYGAAKMDMDKANQINASAADAKGNSYFYKQTSVFRPTKTKWMPTDGSI